MTTGAWIMLAFGCVVLYGGLVWSLAHTKKNQGKRGAVQKGKSKGKRA
jgi:hypothetical protein